MNLNKCPDCESETHFCSVHQKALIEWNNLEMSDVDRDKHPIYLELLEKYGE